MLQQLKCICVRAYAGACVYCMYIYYMCVCACVRACGCVRMGVCTWVRACVCMHPIADVYYLNVSHTDTEKIA